MSITERRFGDYTTGPLLGRGGTSEVYAGTHVTTGAQVAIKLLRSHLASDPTAVAAFSAEATHTSKVAHPNVVRVLDAGGDVDGFYLVMERLDGPTLAACLAQAPLDEATARLLGAAIADGIAAAHANGIVHRDLKPGNVVVVGTSHPIILDFGIARELSGPGTTTSRIGTPAYMAPEQLVGGVIAPCVDIWALGAMLYEMVTGRVPFETDGGRAPQLVEPAPRLSDVSPGYAQLVAACLAKEPNKRPASAVEIARELRAPSTERITEDVAGLPMLAAAPPMLAAAPPMLAGALPTLVAASPMLAGASPMMAAASPMMAAASPMLAGASPMLAAAPPMLVAAPPMMVAASPMLAAAPNRDLASTNDVAPAHKRSRRGMWIAASSAGVVATLALVIGLASRSPTDEIDAGSRAVTTQPDPDRVVDDPDASSRAPAVERARVGSPEPAPAPAAAETPPAKSAKSNRPRRAMSKVQSKPPAARGTPSSATAVPPKLAGEGLD